MVQTAFTRRSPERADRPSWGRHGLVSVSLATFGPSRPPLFNSMCQECWSQIVLLDKGNNKIVLNLDEVQYVDSSGIGELVKTHTTVRNQGGQLRLINLNKRVNDLLQMTRLSAVFDIDANEASAVASEGRHNFAGCGLSSR